MRSHSKAASAMSLDGHSRFGVALLASLALMHARKAKGKTRCVKQAKKPHRKQAKSNRRQGR